MRVLALALASVLFSTAPAVHAQEQNAIRFIQAEIPDHVIDQVLAAVTTNIQLARGENGEAMPPLNEQQRATPLLDRALVREIMDIGMASGVGQACGLEWGPRNFLPLMARERARGDRSQHQIGAIALVHGVMQSQTASGASCGANGASAAASFYDLKWGAAAN